MSAFPHARASRAAILAASTFASRAASPIALTDARQCARRTATPTALSAALLAAKWILIRDARPHALPDRATARVLAPRGAHALRAASLLAVKMSLIVRCAIPDATAVLPRATIRRAATRAPIPPTATPLVRPCAACAWARTRCQMPAIMPLCRLCAEGAPKSRARARRVVPRLAPLSATREPAKWCRRSRHHSRPRCRPPRSRLRSPPRCRRM